MCTVTWVRESDGFQVLFNRDEKHTRMPAAMPQLCRDLDGVQYLAPRDLDHGGTWISVNEFGVCVCLLNGIGRTFGSRVSRGLLVQQLAGCRSAQEVLNRVLSIDLERFAAFVVVGLDAETGSAPACEWDGCRLTIHDRAPMHLTSSSYESAEVCGQRQIAFEQHVARIQGQVTAENLFEFHQSHGAWPSAYSTCMHRDDAETVSFSWIRVRADQVEFFYTPAAPCQWSPGRTMTLSRREVLVPCS
jgi:hypothetical protein